MNLSVIFAWLIAGELGLRRRTKYFIAIFTAILPEMMIAMTFMSEVLYWPLFMLFFACTQDIDADTISRRRAKLLAVSGIVLMYVCLMFKGFEVNNNIDHY